MLHTTLPFTVPTHVLETLVGISMMPLELLKAELL